MMHGFKFTSFLLLALFSASSASAVNKRAACTVQSAGNAGIDDVPAIQSAIQSCGNGGIIILSAGKTYAVRSTVDLTGCANCEVQVEGTLKLSDDTNFWNGIGSVISLSNISGAHIHSVTGSGLIDGNGVPFWQRFNSDSSFRRPTLVSISGGSDIVIEKLLFRNAPNVFHSVKGDAKNVAYRSLIMQAIPTSSVTPKNTDGFDVGASTFVTISNVTVENQDDCVAFKAGCNFLTVTDITCRGSHGLSVGSLGESNDDVVQNVFVSGATMIDSTKATGIKLWDGSAGHGTATVKNITFDNIAVQNCDYAAQIQSCYESTGTCVPSAHIVDGVKWTNVRGTTSTTFDPVVANMNCPADGTCNISFSGFSVKSPSGKANVLCSAVDSNLGVGCSGTASG